MRSASSLAFFSASSKSMASPVTFLAPSLVAFLAPRTLALRGPPTAVVLRRAAEVVMRLAAGLVSAASGFASGEADRAVSLPLALAALRKGDGVRPTTGGVAVRETGGVGRLMEGLSQDEKKSSSGSPAGVEEPSPSAASAITTSPGNLGGAVSARCARLACRGRGAWRQGAWRQGGHRTRWRPWRPGASAPPCTWWRHSTGTLSWSLCC